MIVDSFLIMCLALHLFLNMLAMNKFDKKIVVMKKIVLCLLIMNWGMTVIEEEPIYDKYLTYRNRVLKF